MIHRYLFRLFFILPLLTIHAETIRTESRTTFEGIPVLVKEGLRDSLRSVEVFDPNDSVLYPDFPFLTVTQALNGAELEYMVRTNHFPGSRSVAFARMWQKEHRIERLKVKDTAHTLACPFDGRLCRDEATYPVSDIYRLAYGKGYYEKHGAVPDKNPEKNLRYRVFADFIFTIPVGALAESVRPLQTRIPEIEALTRLLDQAIELTDSESDTPISAVFCKLRRRCGDNEDIHRFYHEFLEYIVGFRNNVSPLLLRDMQTHALEYDIESVYMYSKSFVEMMESMAIALENESTVRPSCPLDEKVKDVCDRFSEIAHITHLEGTQNALKGAELPWASPLDVIDGSLSLECWMSTQEAANFLSLPVDLYVLYLSSKEIISQSAPSNDSFKEYLTSKVSAYLHRPGISLAPGELYLLWQSAKLENKNFTKFVFLE